VPPPGTAHGCTKGVEVTRLIRVGEGWRVLTRKGELSARRVVLAGNGYLRQLAPEVERRVMPINNFIAVTEPLGEVAARRLISNGAAVSDSRFVVNYFSHHADHRLLFGGGENYGYTFPRDIAAFVRPHILKIFPRSRPCATTTPGRDAWHHADPACPACASSSQILRICGRTKAAMSRGKV